MRRALLYALLLGAPLAEAASVPAGFTDRQVASGFQSPTAFTVLPDGRVLVLEQNGVVRMVKDDALLPANFHTVQNVDSFSERGCVGITPDPDFTVNQQVYLYCTVQTGAASRNRVLRVTAGGDVAQPGSQVTLLELPEVPQGVQWHMGGLLRFGLDGKLYVSVGGHEDVRAEPPESSFSQNLSSPFGKILRINPDGSFPADNPFANVPGAYAGIYVLGLRNPYAIDIQPGTGLLYINDVGAGVVEEINSAVPGANFGWPLFEGNTGDSRFANAVYEYGRAAGCAITGGSFYNPPSAQFPAEYVGKYLFSDFCSGWVKMIDPANPGAGAIDFATEVDSPVGLAVAPGGSLYYLARNQGGQTEAAGSGTLGKISFTNTFGPRLTLQPRAQTIFLGDPVTFSVAADDAASYQWRRNGTDIPGATAASYTLTSTSAADSGAAFSVAVSNAQGSNLSDAAALTVTTNRLPAASIASPAVGLGFAPGDKIAFSGTASDAEDGALPATAMSWKVDFMHDTHVHPFYPATSGTASGEFTVPAFDAEAANIWLRLQLAVTDSAGQTSIATRDIYPGTQLSETQPSAAPQNGMGPVEFNRNNGAAAAGDGAPLRLDRIPYAKGIGTQAPAELRYALNGACNGHLIADVGLDDAAGDAGSVVFQVYLDDALAFESGLMRGNDLRKALHINVAGKSRLRLVVSDGGDGNTADLANWGAARVTGCTAGTLVPSDDVAAGGAAAGGAGATGAALASPIIGSGGGGGGCATGGNGRFDPVLPGLLALSIGMLGWRRRKHATARR